MAFFESFAVVSTGSSLILTLSILAAASKTDLLTFDAVDVDDVDGFAKNEAIEDFPCGAFVAFAGWLFFGLLFVGLFFSSLTVTSFEWLPESFPALTSFGCGFDWTVPNRFDGFFAGAGSFFIDFSVGGITIWFTLIFRLSLSIFNPMLFQEN